MRQSSRLVFLLAMFSGLGVSACKQQAGLSELASEDAATPSTSISFRQWCDDWQLSCPTTTPANVPSDDAPWSVEQWQAVLRSFRAVGPDIGFEVNRQELDSPDLLGAAESLGMSQKLSRAKTRLDDTSFTSGGLIDGAFVLRAARDASFRGETGSGLELKTATEARTSINERGVVVTSGVTLAANGKAFQQLGWSIEDKNLMALRTSEGGVSGVPIKFFFEEMIGDKVDGQDESLSYGAVQPAIAPLVRWFTAGKRDIQIEQTAMRELAEAVPVLVADQTDKATVSAILKRLESATSTATSRRSKLLQLKAREAITCQVDADTELTMAPDFGIESIESLGVDGVKVVLYGLKVKSSTMGIPVTINLTRIDLSKTSMTIHNLPVVGTQTIDMTKPPEDNADSKFTCR